MWDKLKETSYLLKKIFSDDESMLWRKGNAALKDYFHNVEIQDSILFEVDSMNV